MSTLVDRGALRFILNTCRRLSLLVYNGNASAISSLRHSMNMVTEQTIGHLPSVDLCSSTPAPSLYADVYEDEGMHASLFGLSRSHCSIPLHDHPDMYGFIKCVRGSIRLRSFTLVDDLNVSSGSSSDTSSSSVDINSSASDFNVTDPQSLYKRVAAMCEEDTVLTPESETVYLGPVKGNVHEITALEHGSIFFDVLIPGYRDDHSIMYYLPTGDLPAPGKACHLQEMGCHPPGNFYCQPFIYNKFHQL